MNKEQLLKLIETLNIEPTEFWVLSSGSLVLRDLLPTANDLDIAVTEEGLNQLKKQFTLTKKENGFYIVNDDVECVVDQLTEDKLEKVGNYYLQSLTKYYEYLKTSTREKDKIKYEIVKKVLEHN